MNHDFASATVLLLLITDPFGNIPVFAHALREVAPGRRAWVIVRENLIAFGILVFFLFAGEAFLRVMGLSGTSLQIAGGVVLFIIALRMIFPREGGAPGAALPQGEPLIVPLAIPQIAGPSAMATVILLASQAPAQRWEWVAALTVTIAAGAVVLLLAERLQRVLGERFVIAMERLMGLILVAVAVEMLVRGWRMVAAGG
ncbi:MULTISPECIES: MarC family protein [Ramlibacter]|uniref:UPF0056 membrane protein n=1 Tax=Ramlibacter aquaticus TaxID=2780094 RepID=A0ABR9SGX0_9BURK|nr:MULTISPECIES: MarC family protein [Ramlibacter]MBE7941596.1 MarC family protein [Ramlibacter aquaticus]